MTAPTRPTPSRYGTAPVAVLTALVVVGLAGWWLQRSAAEDALDAELQAWAGKGLPTWQDPVDTALAEVGAELFREKCAACHTLTGESQVGPDLTGVTHLRSPEWIQAMILAPDSMVEADPAARSLKARYEVQMMVPGGMDTLRTWAVMEFLRRVDGPPPGS